MQLRSGISFHGHWTIDWRGVLNTFLLDNIWSVDQSRNIGIFKAIRVSLNNCLETNWQSLWPRMGGQNRTPSNLSNPIVHHRMPNRWIMHGKRLQCTLTSPLWPEMDTTNLKKPTIKSNTANDKVPTPIEYWSNGEQMSALLFKLSHV